MRFFVWHIVQHIEFAKTLSLFVMVVVEVCLPYSSCCGIAGPVLPFLSLSRLRRCSEDVVPLWDFFQFLVPLVLLSHARTALVA